MGTSTNHGSPFHIEGLTFGCWLHSDLFAEVTSACSGDGCSPDQVLLAVVEVCDSIKQQLWISFILTWQLGKNEMRREIVDLEEQT